MLEGRGRTFCVSPSSRGTTTELAGLVFVRARKYAVNMHRKDKIMTMAISRCKEKEPDLPVTKRLKTLNPPSTTCNTRQKEPVSTNMNKLWSRSLDFNDFQCIFDFNNEYSSFIPTVHKINTIQLLDIPVLQVSPPRTRPTLKCYENMPEEQDFDTSWNMDYDSDDSVKDKDYEPESVMKKTKNTLQIFDIEEATCSTIREQIVVRAEIHGDTSTQTRTFDQTCSSIRVNQQPTEEISVLNSSQLMATEALEPTDTSDKQATSTPTAATSVNEKGFTKSGLPSKRRKFDLPLSERIKLKRQIEDEKLSLKPPCDYKCRRKCTTKITDQERQIIHNRYINLNYETRGVYIKSVVESYKPKTSTVSYEDGKAKRGLSYRYYFTPGDVKVEVCKKYFVTTLGYNSNNNRRIYTALHKELDEQKDRRGSYVRTDMIDKDVIRAHIQSYKPMISHYRRNHAPNKYYLPSDISITMMYQNFITKYPAMTVSFETYRRELRNMNISFAHLGHEECEQCAIFELHKKNTECNLQASCEKCIQYQLHKTRYTTSREEYQKDVQLSVTDEDCIYFSADLQKVIMLPRMEQFKNAIFCPRIIAFNESFVPLGKAKENNIPFAVLWNETISGRHQEDIISAFLAFLRSKRDVKNIIIWTDNCSAQNKNWAFMCFIVNIVNSGTIATETITIKYFEPGHTFMSADHFHHQVEKAMKNKKIYDYDDFIEAVKRSNAKNNIVKSMNVCDFYNFTDVSSQHKLKNTEPRVYLKDVMSVKAEKGEFSLKYKVSHSEWKILDFLQIKIIKNKYFPEVASKVSPRGIKKERKDEIIAKLLPLMPETRRHFWNTIPISDTVNDLATEN